MRNSLNLTPVIHRPTMNATARVPITQQKTEDWGRCGGGGNRSVSGYRAGPTTGHLNSQSPDSWEGNVSEEAGKNSDTGEKTGTALKREDVKGSVTKTK